MTRKVTRTKLTEEQKAKKREEQRERVLKFAPKRMTKLLKSAEQVERIARYPLTEHEKGDILREVTTALMRIKTAFETKGKTASSPVFSFSPEPNEES